MVGSWAPVGTPFVSTQERRRLLAEFLEPSSSITSSLPVALSSGKRRRREGEIYDKEGRRRLHGAFTGGFSAGYFNTVGSEEGWQSQGAFVSRRSDKNLGATKARSVMQQRVEDFMDEEDDDFLGKQMRSTGSYDVLKTVGPTQHEPRSLFGIEEELAMRIVPMTESVGKKIMKSFGWRDGQGIGPRLKVDSTGQRKLPDGSVEIDMHAVGRSFAPPDIQVKMTGKRKNDSIGLGFSERSSSSSSSSPTKYITRTKNSGIGAGVFEDLEGVYDEDGGRDVQSKLEKLEQRMREEQNKLISRKNSPLAGFEKSSRPDFQRKTYFTPDSPRIPERKEQTVFGLIGPEGREKIEQAIASASGSKRAAASLSSRFVKASSSPLSPSLATPKPSFDKQSVKIIRSVEKWIPNRFVAKRFGLKLGQEEMDPVKGTSFPEKNLHHASESLIDGSVFKSIFESSDSTSRGEEDLLEQPMAIKFKPKGQRKRHQK